MSQDSVRVEQAALETEREPNAALALLRTSVGRNAGLVVALRAGVPRRGVHGGRAVLVHRQRASRSCATPPAIGVVSIGMTFVIIGGGIDLSVGAIARSLVGLVHHQGHPGDGRGHALARDGGRGAAGRRRLRSGQRAADLVRQDRAVHHDPGDAGQRPWSRRDHQRQADPDRQRPGFRGLLQQGHPRHRRPDLAVRPGRDRRLDPAQPHDVRAPYRRGRAATPRPPAWPAST